MLGNRSTLAAGRADRDRVVLTLGVSVVVFGIVCSE